jgi:hypothetical protein
MSEKENPTLLQRLDEIPIFMLVIAAFFLGIAPIFPEPHLWQKLKMLAAGELVRPLDIFDLLMHSAPSLLLILRLARLGVKKGNESAA